MTVPRTAAGVLATLSCALLVTLAACNDSAEAPAGGGGGGSTSETRHSGEPHPTETHHTTPHSTTHTTGPTSSLPYFPPSNCPTGRVC